MGWVVSQRVSDDLYPTYRVFPVSTVSVLVLSFFDNIMMGMYIPSHRWVLGITFKGTPTGMEHQGESASQIASHFPTDHSPTTRSASCKPAGSKPTFLLAALSPLSTLRTPIP